VLATLNYLLTTLRLLAILGMARLLIKYINELTILRFHEGVAVMSSLVVVSSQLNKNFAQFSTPMLMACCGKMMCPARGQMEACDVK
jgi:hypothetical protein